MEVNCFEIFLIDVTFYLQQVQNKKNLLTEMIKTNIIGTGS